MSFRAGRQGRRTFACLLRFGVPMPQPSNELTATWGTIQVISSFVLCRSCKKRLQCWTGARAVPAQGLCPVQRSVLSWPGSSVGREVLVVRGHLLGAQPGLWGSAVGRASGQQGGVKEPVFLVLSQWCVLGLACMVPTGAEITCPTESGQGFLVWLQLLGWIVHSNQVETDLESRWT